MCEPERSRGPSLRAVLPVLGGLVALAVVVTFAAPIVAAVLSVEAVLAAVGVALLVRNLRPARPVAAPEVQLVRAPYQIERPPLAVEAAPVLEGVVADRERMRA